MRAFVEYGGKLLSYWTAGNTIAATPAAAASQSMNSINVKPEMFFFIASPFKKIRAVQTGGVITVAAGNNPRPFG